MFVGLINLNKPVTGINYVMQELHYYAASLVNPYTANNQVQNFILASQEPLDAGSYVVAAKLLHGAKFNGKPITFIYATQAYQVDENVADSKAKFSGYVHLENSNVVKQETTNGKQMIIVKNAVVGTQTLNPASNVPIDLLIRSNQYVDLVADFEQKVDSTVSGLLVEGSVNLETKITENAFNTKVIVSVLKFETVQSLSKIKAEAQAFDALFSGETTILAEQPKKASRRRKAKKPETNVEVDTQSYF